jgi:hypothetical protein
MKASRDYHPMGGWIAYVSDESRPDEVYVERFPSATGKVRISTQSGSCPQWRLDSTELFDVAGDGKLVAATVKAGAPFVEIAHFPPGSGKERT